MKNVQTVVYRIYYVLAEAKFIPAEKLAHRCDAAPALQPAQLRCVLKTPVQKGFWPVDSNFQVKNIEKRRFCGPQGPWMSIFQ